jgi:alcohol dehydrogenase (cytochrome c)
MIVETEVAPASDEVEWINPAITPDERRKVVTGIPGKPGIVWTLDAATGDFLWARSTFYQNVIVGVDIEHRRGIANPEIRHPEIGEEIVVCPHLSGGILWQAGAYSPRSNALYAPTNNTCMRYTLNPVELTLGGHHGSAENRRIQVPGSDEQVGQLMAVDVRTGRTLWEHRQRAGFGGSVLTTGGGLVFVTDDARRFRAFDERTGEVLWEQILNSSAGGFPVTYMLDGVQYLAIAAGGGPNARILTPEIRQRPGGNMLFVFRLP